ncbi:hypothetical protein [Variovorax sp. 22077]|uniref:hypothetical protein n=1 Tax=Variovorax sp. 22077 TaxID=3453867 RepID=UPI003F8474DB
MSGGNDNSNFDDLHDPALRRALDHAPDSEATPHPRTREAILKMAHNLAAAPVDAGAAANNASAAPWWRRLFGGGEPHARMPWNAAFATVLVAAFVTVLWHKEPVPDAQLDGEARVGGAAAPAQAPAALPAPAAPAAPKPAQPPAEAAAAQAETQAAPAAAAPAPARTPAARTPESEQRARIARESADSSAKRAPKEAANTANADAARKAEPAPPLLQATPAAPSAPVVPAAPAPVAPPAPFASIAPAPPPPAVAERAEPAPLPAPLARDERREAQVEGEQRRRAYAAGAPAAAAPALPPATVVPAPAPGAAQAYREPLQDSAPALARQDHADATASGAVRPSAPAPSAAKAIAPRSAAPFSALDRWTSLGFTRNGESVRRERGDVEGLAALVGTVARSATAPDEPLAAPVEARLELYRGKALVAVLEIAGDQVRWTPQPGGAALVGTPPAQALDALRSLLSTR